jgi:hypothetical protein
VKLVIWDFDGALALAAVGWTHAILSNHVPELRQLVGALGLEAVLEELQPDEAWMVGDLVPA